MKTFNQFPNPFYFLEKKVTIFGKLGSGMARYNYGLSKFYLLLAYVLLMMLFLSSQISAQVSCCNILTNGDFESGNTEFTSGLANNCTCTVSSYCVGNNFQNKCSGWPNLSAYSGSNFLIIDGNAGAAVDVWVKTTPIVAGQKYCISFWTANVYNNTFDLGLTVNGTLVPGAIFIVQAGPVWTQHMFMWTATSSGSTIAIRQMTAGSQRDFGIDEIEFGSNINANFAYQANTGCGMSVSLINQSSGAQPLSYSWDFGDPTSPNNISTQTNPTHLFTDCGTYLVCLTVFKGNCIDTICKSIVVSDLIPPVARCLGVGVVLDANCNAIITPGLIDAGSSDNCQIQSMSVSPNVLTGCGLFPVVLTVTDVCGNTSTCEADVQTIETVAPVITCPSNISVNANFPNCSINVNGIKWVTATDNCGTPVVNYVVTGATNTFGIKDASGTIFNQGVSTVTYTATDDCGNTTTCSFTVTVSCKQETCTCTMGGNQTANLVVNGNFSSGNAGFTNDYQWFIPGSNTAIGDYSVLNTSQVPVANTQWACNGNGLFLICDGSSTFGNNVAWRQTIPGSGSGTYNFCFSANNLVIPSRDYADPVLGVFVNNVQVAGPFNLPENPDQWIPISFTWTGTLPATFEIRSLSNADIGNDFAIDDICLKPLDTCICGTYDFLYSIGRGPLEPKHCGDTLFVPSSKFNYPIQFLSSFACIGANCTAKVDWILTGPAGSGFIPISMNQISANPGYSIPITNATFTYPGLYTLTITGYCNGQPCPPCILYFNAEGHQCCQSYDDFCMVAMNAVSLSVNNDSCKVTITIGNLPACDFIGPIIWGDGTQSVGPFSAGNMAMHVYSNSGTYYVSWAALEYDYSVIPRRLCYEKFFRDTIKIECHDCICDPDQFISMFYRPSQGAQSLPAKCGDTLMASCKASIPWTLSGLFECIGLDCDSSSLNWELIKPNGFSSGVVNWSAPGFNLSIPASEFINAGFYTLSLQAICGKDTCECNFIICVECCIEEFEDEAIGSSGQWQVNNGQLSVVYDGLKVPPSQVLRGDDDSGASYMYNSTEYTGNWIQQFGGNCFCFDIRYDNGDPSNPTTGTSTLNIYQGSFGPPRAAFIVNPPGIGNNWTRVCAPLGLSSGGNLPTNQYGTWSGVSVAQWDNLIQNVTGIGFVLDFAGGSFPAEKVYVDNICIEKCNSIVSSNDLISSKWKLGILPNPNSGSFIVELTAPAIPGMIFQIIDLTGRVQLIQECEITKNQQMIDATNLSQGLYFLQVMSKGKVLAIEKFVKQ
jgi:PKD repeat protein